MQKEAEQMAGKVVKNDDSKILSYTTRIVPKTQKVPACESLVLLPQLSGMKRRHRVISLLHSSVGSSLALPVVNLCFKSGNRALSLLLVFSRRNPRRLKIAPFLIVLQ